MMTLDDLAAALEISDDQATLLNHWLEERDYAHDQLVRALRRYFRSDRSDSVALLSALEQHDQLYKRA